MSRETSLPDPCRLIDSALRETRARIVAMNRQNEVLDAAARLVMLAQSLGAEVRVDLRPVGVLSLDLLLSLTLEVPEPCDPGPMTVEVSVENPGGCGWDGWVNEPTAGVEDCPPAAPPPPADDAGGGGDKLGGAGKAEVPAAAPDQGIGAQPVADEGPKEPPAGQDDRTPPPPMRASVEPEPEDALLRGAWSGAEDAKAIDMRIRGHTMAEIARALGRPVPATEFRLKKTLRDRLEAERENRAKRRPNTPPGPAAPGAGARLDAPAPASPPADAAAEGTAEAAPGAGEPAADPDLPGIAGHLDSLPVSGWSLQDDLEVMAAMDQRLGIPDLEEMFGVKISVLRKRKEQLTAQGRYPAADVQAELQARADARG